MRKTALFLTTEDDDNDAVFTPWSLVHVAAGAVAKKLGLDFWTWQLLHGVYELKDQVKQEEYRNSIVNSVGDQAATTLGYILTRNTWDKTTVIFTFLVTSAGFVALGDRVG